VFTLPFMVRTVSAAFSRPELTTLEEAARSLGANFRQRFLGILVPAVLPSIAAGSLMVFTLSVGEFNLTWMLHTAADQNPSRRTRRQYASMRLEIGSAYTLLFFIVVLPVLWSLQWLVRLFERSYGT
jgi:putative spermidine/putrescine transport system permease protein